MSSGECFFIESVRLKTCGPLQGVSWCLADQHFKWHKFWKGFSQRLPLTKEPDREPGRWPSEKRTRRVSHFRSANSLTYEFAAKKRTSQWSHGYMGLKFFPRHRKSELLAGRAIGLAGNFCTDLFSCWTSVKSCFARKHFAISVCQSFWRNFSFNERICVISSYLYV